MAIQSLATFSDYFRGEGLFLVGKVKVAAIIQIKRSRVSFKHAAL